ncbi:hypothetical protein ABT235_17755 [Micromonospora echinofusca]|uniref:hypothetical protein n=1 Tax=Micromonospora echinofusca TaxID=47858 RepID=UPI00332202D1
MHEQRGFTGVPAVRRRRAPRRFLTTGLTALLTATGAVVVTAQPAVAAPARWVLPTSVSYTDARQQGATFTTTEADVPVGTLETAGVKHTTRAYLTFDLTPYQGKEIIDATLRTGESAVADCDRPRELELWRTDSPATAPTWDDAPTVREKVGDLGPTAPCPAAHLELPLTRTVQQAVDAGRGSLTLMVRVPGEHEENKHHGRRLRTPGISLTANAAPDVPGALTVAGRDCAGDHVVDTATPTLTADVTDPDASGTGLVEQVTATFAWWPVDRPDERTEWTSGTFSAPRRFQYTVPAGAMVDGGRYAFAVRAADQHATSAWSAECRFAVDTTSPAQPTVSSTDYPADDGWYGGPGIPGQFTFSAGGDTDTVRFRYTVFGQPATDVAADVPGGSATVTLTPDRDGPRTLTVEAVDLAGNRSTPTSYVFRVRTTSPTITDADPTAGFGQPRTLTFAPRMDDVVEYTYRLDDGPEQTVPATADGTATVTITPTKPGYNTVYVRSRTAGDLPSGEGSYRFHLATKPTVSSVEYPINKFQGAVAGTPGTFVLQAGMPGVTEFVYSFDGRPAQTVAAGTDGSASVGYTPTTAGIHRVTVYTRTADGTVSETFSGTFYASRAS